jgi:hypothetical protein
MNDHGSKHNYSNPTLVAHSPKRNKATHGKPNALSSALIRAKESSMLNITANNSILGTTV